MTRLLFLSIDQRVSLLTPLYCESMLRPAHSDDKGRSRDRDCGGYPRAESCSSAARSVLASNVAMVIGPTPPGTGVIHDARFFAAAKSTSPQSLPSAFRLIPTSITIAPGLIQSPCTKPALPMPATTMSA